HRYLTAFLLLVSLIVPEIAHASPGTIAANRRRTSIVVPGSVTYDTSIGNGVDTNGTTSLPLRVGAHRFYVNNGAAGITGSDSNTCPQAQSAATPKLTLASASGCMTQYAGDQLLVAEGRT